MKKFALSAKTIALMLAAGIMASCSNNSATAPAVTAAAPAAGEAAPLNIRYIDMDSISANYNLAKDFSEAQMRAYSKIDNAQRTRGAEIQKLANSIQQKVNNNGYLSQASYEEDMKNLNKKQSDAETYITSLQREAQQEMQQQLLQLNDSIEAFIKDYNAVKKYDAILFKAAGVYFNPALDITEEVVQGLNARYNKVSGN